MNERIVGRGRIVDGAGVFQDFCFRRWPQCRTIAKDPAMVFDVEWDGRLWECPEGDKSPLRRTQRRSVSHNRVCGASSSRILPFQRHQRRLNRLTIPTVLAGQAVQAFAGVCAKAERDGF